MEPAPKLRLDQLLVERHGYETRSRARDAILRGCVFVDGKKITKPGQTLQANTDIQIIDEAAEYVSRAALKLLHAIDVGAADIAGKVALDLGASTGGFTQVLLEKGARHVFAVDVGTGQLHPTISSHLDVTSIENLNARDLTLDHLNQQQPEIIVSDLSFISLRLALPPALKLAADKALGMFLVKPQFEVGKDGIASGGIVRDQELVSKTVADLGEWLNKQPDWQLLSIMPSPIVGGDGNHEFLMIGRKGSYNE